MGEYRRTEVADGFGSSEVGDSQLFRANESDEKVSFKGKNLFMFDSDPGYIRRG